MSSICAARRADRVLKTVRTGLGAGLAGGVAIWIYEVVVWVGWQHLLPLAGIPRNAVGLVFGKAAMNALGPLASVLGTVIHFGFAMVWGVAFACAWPWFRARGWEASLLALPFAVLVWVAMHVAIALMGHEHPDYLDPNVVIGGVMSHLFYTVTVALWVRRQTA